MNTDVQQSLPGITSAWEERDRRRAKVEAATVREVCRVNSFRQAVQEKQLDRLYMWR